MSQLSFHILIEKEGARYVALCLELDLASEGKTISEARANINEAIELYLEDVYQAGDERDFIPRPAPREEWLKYFKLQSDRFRDQLVDFTPNLPFEILELVHG